jgi:hypothetical protein
MLMSGKFFRRFQDYQLAAGFLNGDFVANIHLVRRNVYLAPIHSNVAVTHQLARLTAGSSKAETKYNAVQAAFELLQEQFASNALRARGLLEVVAELTFLREVNTLGLLLFAQLQTVTYDFGLAVLAMLAGSKVTLFNGALVAETLSAFEEQLDAFAAAKTADGIGIACQIIFSLVDVQFTGLASPFFLGKISF